MGWDGWLDGWMGGWVGRGKCEWRARVASLSPVPRALFSPFPGEGAARAEAKGCGGRGRRRFRLGRLAPAASTKAEGEVDAFLEAGHVRVLWVCVGLVCLPSLQRGLAPALEQASG